MISFGSKSWFFPLYFSWFFLFSWSPISCRKFPGHQFPVSCFPARKCATLTKGLKNVNKIQFSLFQNFSPHRLENRSLSHPCPIREALPYVPFPPSLPNGGKWDHGHFYKYPISVLSISKHLIYYFWQIIIYTHMNYPSL